MTLPSLVVVEDPPWPQSAQPGVGSVAEVADGRVCESIPHSAGEDDDENIDWV